MRIVLRPGHGYTPPCTADIDYSYDSRDLTHWSYQRPGNLEDLYVAEFCGAYLIPALVKRGHSVFAQRALDPVTGDLDRTPTTIDESVLRGLGAGLETEQPRWRFAAAVEGALHGVEVCRGWWASPRWSFDPVASCRWEAQVEGDLYLSIHQNWWSSPKMFGPVVLHYERSAMGTQHAKKVYDRIAQEFGDTDWAAETKLRWGDGRGTHRIRTGSRWGVQGSRLWELRNTAKPAVLVELGFASNPGDAERMQNPAWCELMADAIATGLR